MSEPGFKDHFSARAEEYARRRPTYPAELAEVLARAVGKTRLAWEAGCGSGQLSVRLAEVFDRVVATDASAAQLARAAPQARVEYRVARAECSGLPERSADLAAAAQAAHWFDLEAYYTEVRRVVRPGGAIALVSYGRCTVDSVVDAVVEDLYTRVLGDFWPPERAHVDDGYTRLPFPFAELPAPALVLSLEWDRAAFLAYVETWSAVAALRRAGRGGEAEGFARELETVWSSGARRVVWPLALRLGRV